MSKQSGTWRTRAAGEPENLRTRSLSVRLDAGGKPSTLNEAERSVEVVGATETDQVRTYDYALGGYVPEILTMSGCRIPETNRVVLLDSHSRYGTSSVVGSFKEMRVEGDQLVGRAVFTSQPEGESAFVKLKEGHLTDFSLGYRIAAYTRVEAGKTAVVDGKTISGPAIVATDWEPGELSVCPIGADPNAKARGAARSEDMNKRLREILESRGLPAAATEDEAWAFLETLEARALGGVDGNGLNGQPPAGDAAGAAGPSADAGNEGTRAEGAGQERQRTMEILAMGKRFGCAELAESCVREGDSLDKARQKVLDHVAGQRAKGPGFTAVDMVADERDKFRAAMGDALALRAGFAIEKPAPGAQDLRGLTLREACRESLRMAGVRIPANAMEMVGRALTTSDLPTLLVGTANRSLMAGYQAANETYLVWVDDSGSVSDFKIHTMARAGESDDLEEIPESGEYTYGSQDETKETYKIAKYGKLFAISREAIINDDLGVITDVPRNHGEAAARKIGDIAYGVIIANAAMGDGYALFHSKHANLLSAADITVASLGAAETAMALQKDLRGKRRLNIPVRFLLRAVSNKTATEQFFMTQYIGGVANQPNLTNPWYGERIVRVYEPRLDDDSRTGRRLCSA